MNDNKHPWIISSIVGLLSILTPISIYFLSLPDRSIAFEAISESKLVSTNEDLDGIRIIINNNEIYNASIHRMKITNDGSEPILKSYFERGMSITYPEKGNIYRAKVINPTPSNLSIVHQIERNQLIISPFLFNPGDSLELELITSSSDYPLIDARIAGVSHVTIEVTNPNPLHRIILLYILFSVLIALYARSGWLAIKYNEIRKSLFSRIEHAIYSLTSCLSSLFILKHGINYKVFEWQIILLISASVIIGTTLANRELENLASKE